MMPEFQHQVEEIRKQVNVLVIFSDVVLEEVPPSILHALHRAETELLLVRLWLNDRILHGPDNQDSVAQQPEAYAKANPEEFSRSACGCRIPD